MTERKPSAADWESWVDRQIREADARGEFEDLPGAGKPLPGLHRPRDEQWWLRDYLRREGVSADPLLPEGLRLRKELERLPGKVLELRSERAVREHVAELNRQIEAWLRMPTGPYVPIGPADADEVVEAWLAARGVPAAEPAPVAAPPERASWFSRLRRRWRRI